MQKSALRTDDLPIFREAIYFLTFLRLDDGRTCVFCQQTETEFRSPTRIFGISYLQAKLNRRLQEG